MYRVDIEVSRFGRMVGINHKQLIGSNIVFSSLKRHLVQFCTENPWAEELFQYSGDVILKKVEEGLLGKRVKWYGQDFVVASITGHVPVLDLIRTSPEDNLIARKFVLRTETREEAEKEVERVVSLEKNVHKVLEEGIEKEYRHLIPAFRYKAKIKKTKTVTILYRQEPRSEAYAKSIINIFPAITREVSKTLYDKNPERYARPPRRYRSMFDLDRPITTEIL